MSRRCRLDPQAKLDLEEIFLYIARDGFRAARRMVQRIKQVLRMLAKNPLLGELRPELMPDLRSFSVGNYVVYYLPARNGVDVARILHGARDVTRLFRPF